MVEAIQTFIDGWMAEESVVYTHKEMLFSLKKERNSDIGHYMDEPWRYHANWNKLVQKINHFANKVPYSQSYGFYVVMYRCESWTIKKAEHEELILWNCGAGEDSWESLGLQGDQTRTS